MSLVETREREPRDPRPVPFRRMREDTQGNSFVRFITAHAKAYQYRAPVTEIVREFWPNDPVTMYMVSRAATAPAQTRVSGWAAELAQRVVADVTTALGPVSMGMRLLQGGLVLGFDRAGSIAVPGFIAEASHTGAWVAERQPIPVYNPQAVAAVLSQHKMAAIIVVTREMVESSNAEALIKDLAVKSLGRVLDEVLVDGNPEALNRPAGLRYNIAPSTASATTEPQDAFFEDMSTLVDRIAPVAAGSKIALIGSLSRAMRMSARFYGTADDNLMVLPSAVVINDFLAVACAALVSCFGTEPEIEVGNMGTVTMDDVPPQDPTTPVGAFKSLWQSDSIAVKLRWPVTWALRDPRGFAWMTPTVKW